MMRLIAISLIILSLGCAKDDSPRPCKYAIAAIYKELDGTEKRLDQTALSAADAQRYTSTLSPHNLVFLSVSQMSIGCGK